MDPPAFVDLYHAHNLRDDGGISPRVIRERYERKPAGRQGIFSVWAFRRGQQSISWTGPFAARSVQHPKEKTKIIPSGKPGPASKCTDYNVRASLVGERLQRRESPACDGIEGIGGEQKEIEIGQAAHLAGQAMVLEGESLMG